MFFSVKSFNFALLFSFMLFNTLYTQSVRTEQVIRFENPSDHSSYILLKAPDNLVGQHSIELPATMPAENQVLKVSTTDENVATLSWGNMEGTSQPSIVRAYLSEQQRVSDNTWTKINFDEKNFDLKNEFSDGTFTANEAGYYKVSGRVLFAINGVSVKGKFIVSALFKNGNVYSNGTKSAVSTNTNSTSQYIDDNNSSVISDIVYLNAGDTLELYVRQNTMAVKLLAGGSSETYISIYKIY